MKFQLVYHKRREFDDQSCLVKCDGSSVYSSWQRPCKFIEVGGGRVSLLKLAEAV